MKDRSVYAADLFCGAGGTSTGLALACKEVSADPHLLAVNCWPKAIESHQANHPWAKHVCARLESVVPEQVVREMLGTNHLGLLLASPECTFHSNARGGRPINDQLRASAWVVPRWLEAVRVEALILENVPEFVNWGPVDENGIRIKDRKGETFKAYIGAIRSLGYNVEHRVLNSADYGDATSRRRLFVMARRGDRPIVWPTPTHSKVDRSTEMPMVHGTMRWRSAREVIDFSIPSPSIFGRHRPLSPKTTQRIIKGLVKFSGPELKPFLVKLYGTSTGSDLDDPTPTVTGGGGHLGIAEPFTFAMGSGGEPRSVDEPLPTIVGKGGGFVAEPFVIPPDGPGGNGVNNGPRSVEDPMATIRASRGGGHLVQPFIIPGFGERKGQAPRTHSVDDPLPTVTATGAGKLVEPFLLDSYGGNDTYAARLVPLDGPVPSITGSGRFALVEPILLPDGRRLDIRFRMLQPKELAGAQGFPVDYKFAGTKGDAIKQIGNAVTVNMAKALCLSVLTTPSSLSRRKRK